MPDYTRRSCCDSYSDGGSIPPASTIRLALLAHGGPRESNGVLSEGSESKGKSMQWATYILLCADGSFYVGHTEDVRKCLATHNAGKGAHYTANRRPVKLAYAEA